MNAQIKLGVVLLAAGKSERFGENKLLADYKGRPMVCSVLEAMRAVPACKTCVVTGSDAIAALAGQYGYDVLFNHEPQLGQSHSIHMGVHAMQEMDAALFLVGDQPRLTGASLCRLIEAFCAEEKGIACLRDETHMGNPAVFAARYFPELLALSGDRGAKGVLKAHPQDLLAVSCVLPGELADADTPKALECILKEA